MDVKNTNQFLTTVIEGLAQELSKIIEEKASFFRKGVSLVTQQPFTPTSPDFHLELKGLDWKEKEGGSFHSPKADGGFRVFRNPWRMVMGFDVLANGLITQGRLGILDRLLSYFFENEMIEPLVPADYQNQIGLWERLTSEKARLNLLSSNSPSWDVLKLSFSYSALYHHGGFLREEFSVRDRRLSFEKAQSERGVM